MGKVLLAVGTVAVGVAIGYAIFSSLSDEEKELLFDSRSSYPHNI